MLSEDTQNLLARILLVLAEGERKVEDARKEIAFEDNYDIQTIFKVLDNNGDNLITPKDLQNYLYSHGLEVNFKEVKLLILFYDQDHDFALTFGEIFKIIHPGKEFPNLPKYFRDQELNPRVDNKLYNLLEQEILMARNVLALLDELKHKRDFNIHSAFHALKYYACITGDSVNLFLKNCGMEPTTGDIRAIIKRLDINKDEIVDFCEFHAFLGYPDCSFCCPCFPCPNCGIKYCEECLNDIPCYLLGCDHKSMNSKMRCTSIEHNPNIDKFNSLMNSKNMNLNWSKFNLNNTLNRTKLRINEEEENEKNQNDFYKNNKNKYPFMKNNNGLPGNISPEQYNLLQGLTNPEQLNKFMKINNILDRQNEEPINITKNLSLRLSPLRDFDPKDWGCKNCPCNIHGNPNVPCNCCTCNICPNRKLDETNKSPIKQRKFPKINLYSYTYTYEPDINNGTNSDIFNPKMSNRNKDSPYTNKNGKTMANSSDEEKDYDLIKNRNINRNRFNNEFQNDIIYNDDAMNKNSRFNNYRSVDNDEQENINDINNNNNNNINEKNFMIGKNKQQLNKMYRYEENNEQNNNEENGEEEKDMNENEENINQNEPNDNINMNNNIDNNYNTYSPNNDNNQENPFNRNNNKQNGNIPDNVMYKTSPESFNIGNNKKNPLYDSLGFKLTKTVNLNLNQNSQAPKEEESEDDFYSSRRNIYGKSQKEIIDEEELKFLKYLKALIKSEREIEFARRDLMRQKDFNGEDAFRLFEVAGTGVVTMVDLIFGLKLLGIKFTQNQIKLIFNVYDLDGNGVLNYSDFFDMVIAYKDEDRKEEERRKANRSVGNRNINIFSPKTRELYKKLFLTIIEEEERLEELKLKLEINDDLIKGVFNRINIDGDWICDKYEFVNYCLRNKVCKEKKDAYLAFIRLNRKRDGGLDIKDISMGLKSSMFGK